MTLGVKAGVDPEKLLKAIQDGAFGQGYFLNHRVPNVVFADDYDNAGFMLGLMRKDVGLATELAREHEVPMAMAALAEQELIHAMQRGWGRKDSSAVFLLQEERAGVKVRAPKKVGAAR